METKSKVQKHKKLFNGLICLIVIVCIIFFIQLAYAKYATKLNGSATAQIAQFNFTVTGNFFGSSDTVNFASTRNDGNTNVAGGIIAPGTFGEFRININVKGTQTCLEYQVDINLENKPTNMKLYTFSDDNEKIELLVKENKILRRGFFSYNDIQTKIDTIYWEWPIETGETRSQISENDKNDSDFMNIPMNMRIDVRGIQVKKEPTYLGNNVNIGDFINYKAEGQDDYIRFRAVNVTDNKVEMMPVDSEGYAELVCTEGIRLGYQTDEATDEIKIEEAIKSYNDAIEILNQKAIQGFLDTYGYDGATRALKIEDVNRLTGYKPSNKATDWNPAESWEGYGSTNSNETMTFIVDRITEVIIKKADNTEETVRATELTKMVNGVAESIFPGDTLTVGETVEQGVVKKIKINYTDGESTNAWYGYTEGNSENGKKVIDFFSTTKGSVWLASKGIHILGNRCGFGIRTYQQSYKRAGAYWSLYNSKCEVDCQPLAVVPVVAVSSKIHTYLDNDCSEWVVNE